MTTPKSMAEVFDAAAELLSGEGKWTKNAFARGPYGCSTYPTHPEATCWCLTGALRHVKGGGRDILEYDFLSEMIGMDVVIFNDAPGRQQSEVVAVLRKAAAIARERATQTERNRT